MDPRLTLCLPLQSTSLSTPQALEDTLRSLADQTRPAFDLLIGASAEQDAQPILSWVKDRSVTARVVRIDKPTRLSGLNALLREVKTAYVKFVYPGDCLKNTYVEKVLKAFAEDPSVTLVTCGLGHLSADRQPTTRKSFGTLVGKVSGKDVLKQVTADLQNNIGVLSNVAFGREASFGGFDERFVAYAAFELWLNVLRHGRLVGFSDCLVFAPQDDRQIVDHLLADSMIELSDFPTLREKLLEYAQATGLSEQQWRKVVAGAMSKRLNQIKSEHSLDANLVANAARLLAEQNDKEELVRFMQVYAGLIFDSDLQPTPQASTDTSPQYAAQEEHTVKAMRKDVRMLRKELHRLGNSVSWRATEALHRLPARLKTEDAKPLSETIGSAAAPPAPPPEQIALLREIDELHAAMDRIQHSLSWHITSPLRALGPINRRGELAKGYAAKTSSLKQRDINASIAIFDDIFPLKLSGFRYEEFTRYLEAFPSAHVFSTGQSVEAVAKQSFESVCDEFAKAHPELASRVLPFEHTVRIKADLAYCVFISLAFKFLPYFEYYKLPFVFTLYPGGMFRFNNDESDAMVKRVAHSEQCVGIITTQRPTTDYVKQKQLCPERKIVEIIGGVLPSLYTQVRWEDKRLFPRDKDTLDICFVAFKYSKHGDEKGYPAFVESAKRIAQKYPHARFHVIGGFEKLDADVSSIVDRITFHGPLKSEQLAALYLSMDLIITPTNHSHTLGTFDGFPTGATIEAAMAGVAVIASDTLQQNQFFTDGKEMLLVAPEADEIVAKVDPYLSDPGRLYELARWGQVTFRHYFGFESQMVPRIALLKQVMQNLASQSESLSSCSP